MTEGKKKTFGEHLLGLAVGTLAMIAMSFFMGAMAGLVVRGFLWITSGRW